MSAKSRVMVLAGLLSLGMRVAVCAVTGSYLHPTTWEFEDLTLNMMRGHGFVYPYLGIPYYAFHPPLYDWLSVIVYTIFGHHHVAILVMQALFTCALSMVLVHLTERLTHSLTCAAVAGVLAATHPALLYYDTHNLHGLSMGALLFALVAWAGVRWWTTRRVRDAAWLGAAIGLSMYERGTGGLFLLPIIAWMVWSFRSSLKRASRMAAALLLGFGLVLAPWTIRNYAVFHRFVLMITLKGTHFWQGNNPLATGRGYAPTGEVLVDVMPPDLKAQVYAQTNEIDQQRVFWNAGWAYVCQDPLAFVERTGRKLFYFFWFAPQSGLIYPRRYLEWYRVYYAVILMLALLGINAGVRSQRSIERVGTWGIVGVIVTVGVAQSLFYVEGRHRWGVEPLLLIFTARGLWLFTAQWQPRACRPSGAHNH